MNDKAIMTIKLVFLLAVLVGMCAAAMETQAEPITVMSVQARGGLNVRKEPKLDSPAVYLLEDTETVIALGWHEGWALVAKNNGAHNPLGWVCGNYLK